MSEDSALENLRQDIRERGQTDKILPIFWILLPLVGVGVSIITGIIASVLAISTASIDFDFEPGVGFVPGPGPGSFGAFPFNPGVFTTVAIGFLGGLISTLLYVYLFYLLINRRNKHFARQSRFSEDLINYVKSAADRKKGVDIQTGVSSLERSTRDVRYEEVEKSAGLWAILTIIPFVNLFAILYILYFLGTDYRRHEIRENGFIEDTNKVLDKLGLGGIPERRLDPIPDRSFVLYLVLTVVTLGLFGIYWLYTLITDPNNHFKHHVKWEDELIANLEVKTKQPSKQPRKESS
ncbi:MAG: DUF4234 domain-containing protein [Nitrososphaerales archaeon]